MPDEMKGPEGYAYGLEFSDDAQHVTVRLNGEGEQPAMTVPVQSLPLLWLQLGMVIDSLVKTGVLKAERSKPTRINETWQVGANSMAPGFTAMLFDEGSVQEHLVLMPDINALQMADAIEQKVLQGLPKEMQQDMLKTVEAKRPGGKKFIMPPSRGH